MSDIAIRVEHLSKAYRIGMAEQCHETLMGAMVSFVRSPFENYHNLRKLSSFGDIETKGPRVPEFQSPPSDVIWALRDVSFEVKHGEVMGIIGRNGAGKSTLLKILSRITEPTKGRAAIYGRVGSLLEVGTGFHPDLTGRENVYLNGTILGMRKYEVHKRFEEIVEFSGVNKYIDTPVKRYSSGMRVRLAFAVAAHLNLEILIVDEVLAVGDLDFQKKCIGQMGRVASNGTTVLVVSHQLPTISALCTQAISLEKGSIVSMGVTSKVIDSYLNSGNQKSKIPLDLRIDRTGNGFIRVNAFRIRDEDSGLIADEVTTGKTACFELDYVSKSTANIRNLVFTIVIRNSSGDPLFTCSSDFLPNSPSVWPARGTVTCKIPTLPILPGNYSILIWAGLGSDQADRIDNAAFVAVRAGDFFGTGKLPNCQKHGPLLVKHKWSVESANLLN